MTIKVPQRFAVFAPAPRPTTASPPPTPTPAPPRYTHIPPLEPEEQTVTIKVPQRFPGTSLRRGLESWRVARSHRFSIPDTRTA